MEISYNEGNGRKARSRRGKSMSAKTSADVLIGGKIYTLSGYESEDYLQRVANYINGKINEFDEMEQFRRFPGEMKATLVELNIADDYFKAREQAEKLDQDVKEKDREIYELKHELISLRIKAESSEKTASELEKENRQLLLHKAKLENALEDALLGKVKGQVLPEGQGSPNQKNDGNQTESQKNTGSQQASQKKHGMGQMNREKENFQPAGQNKNTGNQPAGQNWKDGGKRNWEKSQEHSQRTSEHQENGQMISAGQEHSQVASEHQENKQAPSAGQRHTAGQEERQAVPISQETGQTAPENQRTGEHE